MLIAVDFDGTIASYSSWRGEGIFGKPLDGVANAMWQLKENGCNIMIYTSRHELDLIEKYLTDYSIPYDYINHSPINDERGLHPSKQYADIYIDDRSLSFAGEWNNNFIDRVLKFCPWWSNKGDKMREFCSLAQLGEDYAKKIRETKDSDYGGYKVGDLGIRGIYVDIFRKSGRLKSMIWDNYGNPTDEAILDNAVDLANYALSLAGVILEKINKKDV